MKCETIFILSNSFWCFLFVDFIFRWKLNNICNDFHSFHFISISLFRFYFISVSVFVGRLPLLSLSLHLVFMGDRIYCHFISNAARDKVHLHMNQKTIEKIANDGNASRIKTINSVNWNPKKVDRSLLQPFGHTKSTPEHSHSDRKSERRAQFANNSCLVVCFFCCVSFWCDSIIA